MKNKSQDPIPPPDATPEEIGDFWDTHSLADYWDETHEVEVKVNLKSRKRGNKMADTMRFGDFVEVNPRIRLEKGKEYPYIEMADVNPDNGFVLPQKKRVYKGGGSRFQFGDTLFARITPCLENGKIVRCKHTSNEPCFGSTEFFIFRGKPNVSDSTYVFYLALSPIIRDPAVKSMTGASGRQRAILSSVEDIHIPVYSLKTQRKIAAVLSAYDDLIENNTRRIKILEDMAQTLYREWFVHFRFPGHENVPMVESPLGLIPQGWEVKKVKEIVKRLKAGKTYRETDVDQTGKIIVVDQSRADFLGFHDNEPDHNASSRDPIVIFGDHTCKMQLMVVPFSLGPNVVPFIAKDKTPVGYLFFLISSLVETKEYKRYWTELNNKVVAVADPETSEQFSDFTTGIFQKTEILKRRNQNLRQTRDHLLPKLISGEIDVSELDININGIQPTKGGTYIPYPLTERLHSDGKILGGKPVIKGTRLAVAFILGLLKQGWSEKDIVENYPSVVHEDIAACRAYQEKVKRASVSR